MSDPQLPPRPAPPRRPLDAVLAWVTWFGVGRLGLSAVSVAVVVGGLLWLVRTEPPPVESTLPVAAATPPSSTLSPPAPVATQVAPSTAAAVGPVLVHVAGAVRAPGVYELAPGQRVDDAVRLAGGASAEADLDGLNLAASVTDGQRVYVPVVGEVDPATVAGGPPLPTVVGEPAPTGPIDLNAATVELLETLPGVGPATASAIVDDRQRNGPFASVDDLDRVPGIGPAKLAALRDLVTV